jgi:hypothetical protein
MSTTAPTETFTCHTCGEEKPIQKEGGTGYARTAEGHLVCYACCGKQDAEEMKRESRITLYLTGDTITNWPGTLKMKAHYVKKGRHNMAGTRHDAWFTDPHGNAWRGTQYGENTQLIHCRKLKQ